MNPARRYTWLVLALAVAAGVCAAVALASRGGPGPERHVSVRGEAVVTHGKGPYRHMPEDVAVQGLAQDVVTLAVGIPVLLAALAWARRGSLAGHLALLGACGYLFVQYFMYLAMGTYNELFLLWVVAVLLGSQAVFRLALATSTHVFATHEGPRGARRYVGVFLIVNAALIALLWLQVVVPPLLDGSLYPKGLAHFTTMIVQGFDLALFLPVSVIAGWAYLKRRPHGELLAPAYGVFLSLQMAALLAKILWMRAIGVSAGPALVIIPLLLAGAIAAALLGLKPLRAELAR